MWKEGEEWLSGKSPTVKVPVDSAEHFRRQMANPGEGGPSLFIKRSFRSENTSPT